MIPSRDPQRIVIIKPSALGDIVQSLPVLAAIRWRFPQTHITWVANQEYAPLLEPIPELDAVIAFHRRSAGEFRWTGMTQLARTLRQLHQGRFCWAIDLQGLLRTGFFSWITLARRRIGLKSAREGSTTFYTQTIDDTKGSQAAVDRYWRVAEFLGAGAIPKRFPLGLSTEERQSARRLVAQLPRPLVAVQPGARWTTKRWPGDSFATAINGIKERGFSAVLVGGPGEANLCDEVARQLKVPSINTAGKTSLRILAALLEACDVALTNDSGPMHLAAAVGTPVVAVFTCTSPERAGPFGTGHRIHWTNVPCRGSYVRTCDRMDCMRELTPGRVGRSLAEVLDETRLRRDIRRA